MCESYLCVNDNVVYFRKGFGVWRGKILDFFNYRGLQIKVKFDDNIILSFPASKFIKTESFWFIS